MRLSVPLAVALAALVAVSVSVAKSPKKPGPAARPAATHPSRPRSTTGPGGARHPYWLLERRYVAQQHRMGVLGAEVRRLRHERLGLLRERRTFHAKARTLQTLGLDPVAAEAQQVVAGLLCIHGGEGSWTDTGSPYWGGLQMDETFQANYAPPSLRALGTADHWTPLEQLAVGVIGWSLQGHWAPWPRTSRACGLQ